MKNTKKQPETKSPVGMKEKDLKNVKGGAGYEGKYYSDSNGYTQSPQPITPDEGTQPFQDPNYHPGAINDGM